MKGIQTENNLAELLDGPAKQLARGWSCEVFGFGCRLVKFTSSQFFSRKNKLYSKAVLI